MRGAGFASAVRRLVAAVIAAAVPLTSALAFGENGPASVAPLGVHDTKIRSPQITGEECPEPGSVTRQLMSLSLICSGRFALPAPLPFGPRKRVHSCACVVKVKAVRARARRRVFMA